MMIAKLAFNIHIKRYYRLLSISVGFFLKQKLRQTFFFGAVPHPKTKKKGLHYKSKKHFDTK